MDVDDRPYEELVAAFSRVNPGLAAIHQEARLSSPAAPGAPPEIPAADIDPHDRSLRDWPKEQALIPGLVATSPEVVFGDVDVAWNHAGLYGDVLRIVAEVFLPWSALGVTGPPPDRQPRLELAATGWYRASWMS